MNTKIGRPKVENPKNVDIKVRVDEKTNKKILSYCNEKNTTRTNLIREGVKNQIVLDNGLEYEDIKKYEDYLNELINENICNFNLDRVEDEISNLNRKLGELYGLIENLRDKYLDEEYGIKYEDVFQRGITVNMPINADIFFVQNKYYKTLMKLYDIRMELKLKKWENKKS